MENTDYNYNLFSYKGKMDQLAYIIVFFSCWMLFFIFLRADNTCDVGDFRFSYLDIPLFWIYCASRTKRCRDLGMSGWLQLLPFWGLLILFEKMRNKTFRVVMTVLMSLAIVPIALFVLVMYLFAYCYTEPNFPGDIGEGLAVEKVEGYLDIEINEHELLLGHYISGFPSPDGQFLYVIKLPDNHVYEQIMSRGDWTMESQINEDDPYLNRCIYNVSQYKNIELEMPSNCMCFYDLVYNENSGAEGWVHAYYDVDRNIIYCVFVQC